MGLGGAMGNAGLGGNTGGETTRACRMAGSRHGLICTIGEPRETQREFTNN